MLVGLAATAVQAGLKPAAHKSGTGTVLALAAQLRTANLRASLDTGHAPSGRSLLPRKLMRSGALVRANAAAPTTTPIPGAVQTYDVFSPAPAFRPLIGYDSGGGALGNNPQNPPLYIATANPTNLTPVWSQDETFIVFSSNRTQGGTVAADGRFHLWAISVNGGEAYQITTSTGPVGGGEFFPTLNSSNNTEIAFTSDAQSAGVQNLYAIQFSLPAVVAGTPANISDAAFVLSPTNVAGTGFDQVGRPTISPADSNLLVFSARSTAGTNLTRRHIYFLYLTTGGFDANNRSLPAKLTDGPADDTDPAYSNDGQYIAFASTASAVDAQTAPNNVFSPNPNTSQSVTSIAGGTTAASNRSIFLLSGGTGSTSAGASGFGTPPASLQSARGRITLSGTDNFGPAWSYTTPNQYTNSGIGFEYLAFARGASQTTSHDIYTMQTIRGVNSQGETGRSYEVATTPEPVVTPVYQIAAGGGFSAFPYTSDSSAPNGLPFYAGGASGANATAVDRTNDPATPAQVYSAFRVGGAKVGTADADQFTYTIPNLTPRAAYTVKLHLSDPAHALPNQRVFNLSINGQFIQTVDIAQLAGGQNKAVILAISSVAATDYPTFFTGNSTPTQQGRIVINFAKGNSGIDEPLVNGIEVDTSNSAATSAGFGGYFGTAQPGAPVYFNALGGTNPGNGAGTVTLKWRPVAGAVSYNIYRTPFGSSTSENTPNSNGSGLEGNVPYLTGVVGTPGTGINGGLQIAADPDPNLVAGNEYFYQITAIVQQSITPETNGSNVPVKLVTETNPPSTTNAYDDIYPSWSPERSIYSICYGSNRSVSYNDPTTGFPVEAAVSLPRGQVTTNFTVGPAYSGVLISQVLNLDPPTLLRFSPTETIHIQPGNVNDPVNGTPTKSGLITGGQSATFTIRLSNREAGIDDDNIYLQIKDPDSKYQDSQRLEHKVFAKDGQFGFQSNRLASDFSTFSGNEFLPIGGPGVGSAAGRTVTQILDTWPTYGVAQFSFPRGALGGFWDATQSHIYIGKSGGGNNPRTGIDTRPNPAVTFSFPGDDPALFVPWGPEYECQYLNAQYAGPDSVLTDYQTPYYLAGVDDQQAFSGVSSPARPEYLKLTRVLTQANRTQFGDAKGGVLYSATWPTPTSGSDFYLDVIAYDKAVFPTLPDNTSPYQGQSVNWRIYDNVGGFSTNLSIGNNDVLVVSDYSLGQKFAGSTFNGSNGNLNLVPKLYGAESYFTDVDVNILPDTVFAGYPTFLSSDVSKWRFGSYLQKFGTLTNSGTPLVFGGMRFLNGLGVGSYSDGATSSYNQGTTVDGVPYDNSQKYSIWRILARGPVPQQTLNTYMPTKQPQPAVVDLQGPTAYQKIPAATVLDAHRCVVWIAPYTGDLLTDPGTLDDPGSFNVPNQPDRQSTQTVLRNYVQGGGRLFISGQDIASSLTLGGTAGSPAGSFLSDVLSATYVSSNGGTNTLSGTNNRITGDPGYDGLVGGYYPQVVGNYPNPPGFAINYQVGQPAAYPYLNNMALGSKGQSDGSLDQRLSPLRLDNAANLLGQIDTIAPANGATVAMTYVVPNQANSHPGAMVIHDDPYGLPATGAKAGVLPNGGTGSRTVYGAFGLEAMSNDTYAPVAADSAFPFEVAPAAPRNTRANILHNILTYLRTGSISGLITQTAGTGAGAGQGVPGATVYVLPFSGTAPPTRVTFSATTDQSGLFSIVGIEPGVYTLASYKAGYSRAASNTGVTFTVEGDVNVRGAALTIAPLPPANIAGVVHDPAGVQIDGATVTFVSQDQSITKTIKTANGSVSANPAENYFLPSVPITNYNGTATGPLNPQNLPEYADAKNPDPPAKTGDPDYSKGVTVQPNTTTQPVNFTLTPLPASISGTVTSSVGGAPVPGATVSLTDSAGKVVGPPAVTKADGTYLLSGIPAAATPTTYSVSVTAPGFAPSTALSETVYFGSVLTAQDFSLTPIPPGSIKASVVYLSSDTNLDGTPVAGAKVTYTPPGSAPVTVTTGADGTVTISPVPPATYSVTAIGPLNANGKPTTAAAPAKSVVVTSGAQTPVKFAVVPTQPSFSGTVSAAPATTGGAATPLAGAAVTVTGTDNAGTAIAPVVVNTRADGTYTTGPLPQGTYTVTASKGGFVSASQGPTTVQYGDVVTGENFTLTAAAPGSITGTVLDSLGAPVSGAAVTFKSNDGTVKDQTATTAADGSYVIPPLATAPNVPAATYTGTAVGPPNANKKQAYDPSQAVTVTVPAGGSGRADFVLPIRAASVSGKITDAQNAGPIAGATVTLLDPAGKAVGSPVSSGADGTYAFSGIPATQAAQSYTVTAAKAGYFGGTLAVSLALGDAAVNQDIALNEQAILYGLITDGSLNAPGSPPLAGVTITVTNSAGGVVATLPTPLTTQSGTVAGPDGKPSNYTATLLPGAYTVTASKGSYDSKTSVVVQATQATPVRVDLALISSIGTLGGLVTDQNGTTPVGGATITATLVGGAGTAAGVTFTTVATATPGADGAPVNYTGQLSKGTYSVTVTKGNRTTAAKSVVIVGGTFNRADFTGTTGLPALHTFASGFQFVSTPYDYSALGFDGLFGTKNTALAGTTPNGNRSSVAVWNPLTGAYALDPTAPADSLRLGVGYWVYLKNAVPVIQQGTTPTATTVRVSLGKGWNQIGVPNPAGVAIQNLAFDNGAGGTISFSQASGSQYNLVNYSIYGYSAGGYQAVSTTGTLQPWNAYWLYVNAPAVLVIPTR